MRRSLLFSLLLIASSALLAEPVQVRSVDNLQALAAQASGRPLLLMFSMDYCGYCVRMEEDYLKPMLRSGDYESKVLIAQLKIDRFEALTDFDGQPIEASDLASRYGVKVTPTLALIGADGRLLSERMEGIGVADFRWAEIDTAIAKARITLACNAGPNC